MLKVGTNNGDIILDKIGSDDFIFGLSGADRLQDDLQIGFTSASDDFYFGGRGADAIWSAYGSDRLYGQRGDDSFDVYEGGDKRVIVDGGKGRDSLTLWDFDAELVDVKDRDGTTVIEQGRTKVVIHQNVEHWEFF